MSPLIYSNCNEVKRGIILLFTFRQYAFLSAMISSSRCLNVSFRPTTRYHNVVCASLDFVCDAPVAVGESPIPTDARLAFFNETRHSYGRTALLLSGGAALGFYHVGVVKALMENRLMPRVLGGSSAGSSK